MVIRIDTAIAQRQMGHINVARWQHCNSQGNSEEGTSCGWRDPRGPVAGESMQNPFRSITHKLFPTCNQLFSGYSCPDM